MDTILGEKPAMAKIAVHVSDESHEQSTSSVAELLLCWCTSSNSST